MLNEDDFRWDNAPDARVVFRISRQIVGYEAQLRIAEEELKIMQAVAKKQKPRTTHVETIGVTDDDMPLFIEKRREIVELKNKIAALEADKKLAEFQKDMFRTHSYSVDRYVAR